MHALGKYLSAQLEARGWTAAEFARNSGLSRQNVYQLVDDNREHLGRLLEERTAHKLAAGLGVPVETIWLKCMESLGVPAGDLRRAEPQTGAGEVNPDTLPDEVLAEQVRLRLLRGSAPAAELQRLRLLAVKLQALVDNVPTGTQTVSTSRLRELLEPSGDSNSG